MSYGATTDSIRPSEAARFLGIARTTLYQWMAQRPDFPKPYHLGARTTVFRRDELVAWRDAQRAAGATNQQVAPTQQAQEATR